jgi:WD40 repeat protein
MLVIQSGFTRVGDVAFGPNQLAVRNGEQSFTPEALAQQQFGQPPGLHDRVTWDVELWPWPPEGPSQRFSHNAYNPFGFDFDPRTGWLLFGEPDGWPQSRKGVKRADGQIVVAPEDSGGAITGFALSPDGERMLCVETWRDMTPYVTPPPEFRFVLSTRTADGGWVRQPVVRRSDEFLSHPAFLPDGERFVATGSELRSNSRRTLQYQMPVQRVFDARTFAFLETVDDSQFVRPPYFCGHWMVTIHSGTVLFRDTRDFSRSPVCIRKGRRKFVALATDPGGRFFLTASGHRVSVWETKTWKEAKTFAWKVGPITCLAVSPDGLLAAAGSATGKVMVWDVE